MSRGDSSRTSESAVSSRSAASHVSHVSTNDTSPRSSLVSGVEAVKLANDVPSVPPVPAQVSPNGSNTAARPIGSSGGRDEKPWYLQRDYEAKEISFNGDGHVTGGTLMCLVERMTLHDTTIDPNFANTFFLTFRLFTTPIELAEILFRRFDLKQPTAHPMTPAAVKSWTDSKATPIRLRIYNFFKTWIEVYWQHESDQTIVQPLLDFARGPLSKKMPSVAQRLIDLVQKRCVPTPAATGGARPLHRAQSTERLKSGRFSEAPAGLRPAPITSKSFLGSLRSAAPSAMRLLEVDPLELARQLTILESKLYCKIRPEELLGPGLGKKGGQAVNVRAMSALSTRLTGWIAETILNEEDAKKRSNLVKYFIKLADVSFPASSSTPTSH
jgi:hypothetical protein